MSTRSIIACGQTDDFDADDVKGVYHHFDGDPEGMGVYLQRLLRVEEIGDAAATMKRIVDDEPIGWSNFIDCTWAYGSQWEDAIILNNGEFLRSGSPQSYTARGEKEVWNTVASSDHGQDYMYYVNLNRLMLVIYERNWERSSIQYDCVNRVLISPSFVEEEETIEQARVMTQNEVNHARYHAEVKRAGRA